MSSLATGVFGSVVLSPAEVAASVAAGSAGQAASIGFPYGLIFREDLRYARLRRAFDIVAAGVALVALSPVLLAASVAIVAEDGRPIFFCQRRVGRFGRLFDYVQAAHDAQREVHRRFVAHRADAIRASRASAIGCEVFRSTSCRSSSMSCAVK